MRIKILNWWFSWFDLCWNSFETSCFDKNLKKNEKFCFILSVQASLKPCSKGHSNRVSNYRQLFRESNFHSFDFTNGFKCSDVPKLQKLNNSSIDIFELIFQQDQNKWKHNIIPIETSENESDEVVDLLLYNKLSALNKITCVFSKS